MKQRLGWGRYSAPGKFIPLPKRSSDQYFDMFEMHWLNGAVFVAPYYMSMLPDRIRPGVGGDLVRFKIAADNPRYGSDSYRQAIIVIS